MGSRDWSEVANDLLDSIAACLEVPDILHFGVVCKAWQAVQAGRRSPRMPWLMLPVESDEYATFLDLSTDDFHTVAMPDDSTLYFKDSKDGWILARHFDNIEHLFLLNPLKQTRISLPPFESSSISSGSIDVTSFHTLRLCCAPADSSSSSSFTVAALSNKWIAILREEDTEWMVLDLDLNPCTSCEDLIQYEEEKMYALMDTGEVHAWDLSGVYPVRTLQTTCLSDEKDRWNKFRKRLVDCAGDLLQVWRSRTSCEDGDLFRIFKLDRDGAFWTPTKSLNACSLFFGVGQCISLSASSVPNLRANLVHFTSKYEERNSCGEFFLTCLVGLLDLDDGSFDTLCTEVLKPPRYVPNLWFALNPV